MNITEHMSDGLHKIPEVVFVWKSEYGWPIEFVSENVAMFGYDAEDFMSHGLTYEDIIHPADLEMVQKALSVYSGNDSSDDFVQDYRIFTFDGDVRWVRERTQPIYDDMGVMVRLEGSIVDITDVKKRDDFMFIQGELGNNLSWPVNLEESLDVLLKLTTQLDAINAGALYLLDDVAGGLVLVKHKGLSDSFVKKISYFEHNSIQVNFAQSGFPIYKHYSEVYPFISGAYLEDEGLQGTAIIPIHYGGCLIGMLFASSSSECIIPECDRDSLDMIKSLMGHMVDNTMNNMMIPAKVGEVCCSMT